MRSARSIVKLLAPAMTPLSPVMVGRGLSQELDRGRPLWEMWLVEGLPRRQWALISKVHHCMVDGVSGTDLMSVLMDSTPDGQIAPSPRWTPDPGPGDVRLTLDAITGLVLAPGRQVASVIRSAGSPGNTLRELTDTLTGVRSFGRRIVAPSAPLSIEGSIGSHRRWAVARCTLADAKAIRAVFGGSVNDVVLTAITACCAWAPMPATRARSTEADDAPSRGSSPEQRSLRWV